MERGQSPLPVSLLVSDDSNSVTTSFRAWWGPNLKGLVGPMVGQPARYFGTARAVLVGGVGIVPRGCGISGTIFVDRRRGLGKQHGWSTGTGLNAEMVPGRGNNLRWAVVRV